MKALFLDRDGIINKERGDYTWLPEQFEFTQNLFPFLRKMQDEGYVLIVITNQGGIEKGLYTKEDVDTLHNYMTKELSEKGIEILDVFYCPHHDIYEKCLCRKPGSLLIEKALAAYNLDPEKSLMLGDRQRDVDSALAAGVKGQVIPSNSDWNNVIIKI